MASADIRPTRQPTSHNHAKAELTSESIQVGAAGAVADTTGSTKALRNLYFVRFGFAIVWGIVLMPIAKTIGPGVVALIIVYPLVDLAAAIIDYRSSGSSRAKAPLFINMALSVLTAIGLAVALGSGIPNVLRVWGVWAITAGIVQLVVAVLRRRLGGQVAMILSGGISVLAGIGFVVMAGGSDPALTGVAGYAILGGIFFLISAIRLHLLIRTVAK